MTMAMALSPSHRARHSLAQAGDADLAGVGPTLAQVYSRPSHPAMTDPASSFGLYGPLFASAAMRAILADAARVQRMLDVEAALARAEAAAGVIPPQAVAPIEAACRGERFDLDALAQAAVSAGNLAIPLVKVLTAEGKKSDPQAARLVHWGGTRPDTNDPAHRPE